MENYPSRFINTAISKVQEYSNNYRRNMGCQILNNTLFFADSMLKQSLFFAYEVRNKEKALVLVACFDCYVPLRNSSVDKLCVLNIE